MFAELFSFFTGSSSNKGTTDGPTPNITLPTHPFYPTNLKLPTYIESTYTTTQLLSIFVALVITVVTASLVIIRTKSNVSTINKLLFVWFIICGFIHLFLEGYFSYFHKEIVGDNSLMSQLWKEYALSDSRYLTSDPFVVIMEGITSMFWGPLSFLTSIAIYNNWPSRYILQLIVSLGQIYGDVLYYFTTLIIGSPHSRPEPIYFWGYFFAINFIWIIIPGFCLYQSFVHLNFALKEDLKRKSCGDGIYVGSIVLTTIGPVVEGVMVPDTGGIFRTGMGTPEVKLIDNVNLVSMLVGFVIPRHNVSLVRSNVFSSCRHLCTGASKHDTAL
nr:7420_t:CDS:2 [Entrophospora candida]